MVSERAEPSGATLNVLSRLREFASIARGLASAQQYPFTDWEIAGQEVWDLSASDEAAVVLADQAPAELLAATAEAALARLPSPGSREAPPEAVHAARALEISLGILANVATHRQVHSLLLAQPGLAPLAARALWADDAASVCEACRLAVALLLSSPPDGEWCKLLSGEEALGRLAWVVENALQSGLLGRALELLSALLTALEEGMEAALTVLLPIDLVQLLTSVLAAWTARLHAEDADFGGSRAAEESSSGSAAADATAAAAPPPPKPPPRVAAEVTPEVLAEALHLLNLVAACETGCAALGGCGSAKAALLELLAATDDAATQLACVTALASVDDVEALLLGSAAALERVLGVLTAARDGVRVGPEELEAAWSLVSRSLRWVIGAATPQPAALLYLLCERAELLADGRWETGSGAVAAHQRFVLEKLRSLLEGGGAGSRTAQQHALAVICRRLDGQR